MPKVNYGLDSYVAEIDRRLRKIQLDLAPDREPREARAAPQPGPRQLDEPHAAIASMRELLDALDASLAALEQDRPGDTIGVSVAAGPFASTAAVREFARALRDLPGVGDVAVRSFEGEDRAVIDVELRGRGR